MQVLVTGAFGRVGSAVVEHLGDDPGYEFTYLDLEDSPDHDTVVADVADYEAIRPAFDGQDAVIHLAAIPTEAPWPDLLENNIVGAYNAYEAACAAGVSTFVFASSNHVVGSYQREHAPELYHPDYEFEIDHTVQPHPASRYGVTKLFGEGLGAYYVEHEPAPIQCYALRICGTRHAADDHPWGDAERGVVEGSWERGSDEYWEQVAKRMAMGTSRRDFAQAVACCLKDTDVEFDVFYVTSDNDASWFDIDHTREVLGYEPQDDLADWDGDVPDAVPRRLPPDAPAWVPETVLPA